MADVAQGAVATDEIANGQVQTAEIGANQVRGSHLLDATLSGADVINNASKVPTSTRQRSMSETPRVPMRR